MVTGDGRMSKNAPDGRIWAYPALVLETNPRCAHVPSSREHWGPAVPLRALVGQTDQAWLFSGVNAPSIKGCKHLEELRDTVRSLKTLSGLVRPDGVQKLPLPLSTHPSVQGSWLLCALLAPEHHLCVPQNITCACPSAPVRGLQLCRGPWLLTGSLPVHSPRSPSNAAGSSGCRGMDRGVPLSTAPKLHSPAQHGDVVFAGGALQPPCSPLQPPCSPVSLPSRQELLLSTGVPPHPLTTRRVCPIPVLHLRPPALHLGGLREGQEFAQAGSVSQGREGKGDVPKTDPVSRRI